MPLALAHKGNCDQRLRYFITTRKRKNMKTNRLPQLCRAEPVIDHGPDQPASKHDPHLDRAQDSPEVVACPADFVPLHLETRTHVSTRVMCYHLDRKEQTARCWACHEDGPLRPIRINGRLAWAVADIKRLLGV